MTNINYFSIIKQNLSFNSHRNKTQAIPQDNARIKNSLVSTANDFGTIVLQQRAVSVLSAKFQDSVNAQVFIWTQFI